MNRKSLVMNRKKAMKFACRMARLFNKVIVVREGGDFRVHLYRDISLSPGVIIAIVSCADYDSKPRIKLTVCGSTYRKLCIHRKLYRFINWIKKLIN